jgi:hypothetical protein
MASCTIPPMNPWNLHWKFSIATETRWIKPDHYQSTLVNVCSCESLIPGYLISFWSTQIETIKYSVPHCLTINILDEDLWARCSKDPFSMYKGVSELQLDAEITGQFGWWVMWQGPIKWDKKCQLCHPYIVVLCKYVICKEWTFLSVIWEVTQQELTQFLHGISPWQQFGYP